MPRPNRTRMVDLEILRPIDYQTQVKSFGSYRTIDLLKAIVELVSNQSCSVRLDVIQNDISFIRFGLSVILEKMIDPWEAYATKDLHPLETNQVVFYLETMYPVVVNTLVEQKVILLKGDVNRDIKASITYFQIISMMHQDTKQFRLVYEYYSFLPRMEFDRL